MLADPPSECYDVDLENVGVKADGSQTPVRALVVRPHATGCSLREAQDILRLFCEERSHQAIFRRGTSRIC